MASHHYPDKWCVIDVGGKFYKLFASIYGGYTSGDSWKLNSGITKVIDHGDTLQFFGTSGTSYTCDKLSYGSHMYGEGVLNNLIRHAAESGTTVTIMDENTDWMELNYE